jgi:thiol-disulfide isomerase/thioredoxin
MKIFENQKLKKFARAATPWGFVIGLILLLKVTGIGSSISLATQGVLMKAGAMDAKPATLISREEAFNYNFIVKDLDGKELAMSALKGKVIFLNLWATWCGPCRVEMPVILSLDQEAQQAKIAHFISSSEFTFPVYQPASPLPKQLRVNTIPTTFIISPDGKVKTRKIGMANYDTDAMRVFLRELSGV